MQRPEGSPYESPIEELMAESLRPLMDSRTDLTPQVKVGKYRVDLMLSKSERLVAVECDGREFHNFRDDLRRDIDLLGEGIAAVVHFRGCDIVFQRDECVERLRSLEPQFFGDAKPLSIEDTGLVCAGMAGWGCKPIYRTGDGQFRDPAWTVEYRGPTAQPLGDLLTMLKWSTTFDEFILGGIRKS